MPPRRTKKIKVKVETGEIITRSPTYDMLGNWGFTTIRYKNDTWLVDMPHGRAKYWTLRRKLRRKK